MGTNNMKYFSMFSGIGGFKYGILRAYRKKNGGGQEDTEGDKGQRFQSSQSQGGSSSEGWNGEQLDSSSIGGATCVGYSEIDKYAVSIYEKHFKGHKNYGNCREINWEEVEDFDMLVGGFPCQAFSIAGKRGGFDDTRGTLFFEIARCIEQKQPRLLVLENVKGLLSHDKGNTFYTILTTLDELGYDLQWQVLNSKNFGVPQNRERVFIVGHLRGTSRPEVFPIGGTAKQVNKNVFIGIDNHRREGKLREYKGICPTLNTNNGGQRTPCTLEDSKIRRLTTRECERLQGFPDDWTKFGVINKIDLVETIFPDKFETENRNETINISDTQRYKMCGNAVTVNVIKEIIKKLI